MTHAIDITRPVIGLAAGIGVGALFLLLCGCPLKHPVPCDGTEVWPDPCAYGITETTTDAGDASRD